MDCKTAWSLLPYAKPHAPELDASEGLALQHHLQTCGSCATAAAREQAFDAVVGQAMRDVTIPAQLKDRILVGLANERHRHERSRLLYFAVAAAAVVILGLGLNRWLANTHSGVVSINLDELAQRPWVATPPHHADDVAQWFERNYGVTVDVPTEFNRQWNFDLVQSAYLERSGNEVIPVLVFRNKEAFAKVYLLRAGQYVPEEAAALISPPYADAPRVYGKPTGKETIALVVLGGDKSEYRKFHHAVALPKS